MIVINLYGGPGTGKSTTAAGLFNLLKVNNFNCELVTEYAKDKVWEGSITTLANPLYVFAKQSHRLWRCKRAGVDICVTDSPILLALVYQDLYQHTGLCSEQARLTYNQYTNVDIFLNRKKEYNPLGRNETEEGAIAIDSMIKTRVNSFLNDRMPHDRMMGVDATPDAHQVLFELLKESYMLGD